MSLERNSKLVTKKFISYLFPSILMIFAMQFGSLLDGILIGNFIGPDALGATSLVLPILYVIQIPGFALGVRGSIVIANLLGKRDIEKAKKVFSFSIVLGVAISLVFTAISFFVSGPLARLFGEASLQYSEPYVFLYLLTDPIVTLALLLGNFIAVDNSPKLSSGLFIIGNAAKVGLEILFIQVFQWGMYGAAASTAAGYLIGLVVLIFYVRSKKRLLSFTFKIGGAGLKEIIKASSTSGLNLAFMSIQMLVVNIFVGSLITDPVALIGYGLISNMVFVFDLFCGGPINLIPSLCGVFYGEKDIYSLKSITRKIYIINLAFTLIIAIIILAAPGFYALLFGYAESGDFAPIARVIRIFTFSFFGYEISKFSMNYYPSIDKNLVSIIVVFARELVIVLPLTIGMLFAMGLEGYAWAYVITETVTVLITYGFVLLYNRKKKGTHGIFMFEKGDPQSMDVTIKNDEKEVSVISESLTKFALEHDVPNRESQIVGLAAEEIASNIIAYGYKRGGNNYIDVNFKKIDNTLILRIRDDGLPFDPTKYEFDNDEAYSTSGILLIKNLTDKMTYMRVLNMNNTIFEIKIKGASADGI
ncbi:MAG: ATP-binding protein [Bacilli bacterium]|nr:ATP-binding protein [Bacilli bacterium]